jgi:CheY-like chemotaxis protein
MIRLLPRRRRVLVLDDDPAMQRLVARILRSDGCRADVTGTGAEAIRKLAEADYDALLLDVMLPTEGAYTVIAHLRENRPEMLARVLLVTASPESVLRNLTSEVAGVVHKPFQPEQLTAALRKVLGR